MRRSTRQVVFTSVLLGLVVVVGIARSLWSPLHRAPAVPSGRPAPVVQSTPAPPLLSVPSTPQFAVPVLMYHRIADLTPEEMHSPLMRDLTVSPAHFDQQVRYLAENGFTFLLARDVEEALQQGGSLPEKAVAITMDDGYKDNFEQAFPILRKYNALATLFLVTGTVN